VAGNVPVWMCDLVAVIQYCKLVSFLNILFQEDAGVNSDQVLRDLIATIDDQLQSAEYPIRGETKPEMNVDIVPIQARGESNKNMHECTIQAGS